MVNKVVPTFFKKSVSLSTAASLDDVLTESLYVSVTPVTTNRQYVNSQVSMSTVTGLEDMLSEAVSLSFTPNVKIMSTAANTGNVVVASTGYYWYQS